MENHQRPPQLLNFWVRVASEICAEFAENNLIKVKDMNGETCVLCLEPQCSSMLQSAQIKKVLRNVALFADDDVVFHRNRF